MRNVAVVTGAGSGIGKACSFRFAQTTDVSATESCELLAEKVLNKWGGIDVLVANADVQIGGSLLEATEDDWDRIIGINLKGVAYSCKAVLPTMIEQASGAIVINSSINAVRGKAGMAIYDMSKAAVLALTRNLAVEHGASGIRVNAVCPGDTLTEFHIDKMAEKGVGVDQLREMTQGYALLGRAGEPSEIANAIYFLAGDEASFITGQALCVDGGFSVTGGGNDKP